MRIFIMALEPIETRYTGQWYSGLPEIIKKHAPAGTVVYNVPGEQVDTGTTAGAFLNFGATNIWKNTQINAMAENFMNGYIESGDKVLFPDAWHPGVIQIKYMSDLFDIPVEIHAIWHAGSYDPQDFLGRKVKNKSWSFEFERSLYYAIDKSYFATNFHIDLFWNNLFGRQTPPNYRKVVRSGQPHHRLPELLETHKGKEKEDLILFPHRIAEEKQPEIFRDLAREMPEYRWEICQEKNLTKEEYHDMLARSKMVFSANLQETLGISAMEAVLVDSIPFVPDRLSYVEMYEPEFRYFTHFTSSWQDYQENKEKLKIKIREVMNNYDRYRYKLLKQEERLKEYYLYPKEMLKHLLS